MSIDSFTGEYRFLSNFFIEPDGSCVEVDYQASKHIDYLHDPKSVLKLFDGLGPSNAKKLGRRLPLRPDWESVKLDLMKKFVIAKFVDHEVLAEKLLATGDEELIEDNYWMDTFWGVCRGVGDNHLGKILMQVRRLL
jgi:ribA/ribD-fused uncharacterized protein